MSTIRLTVAQAIVKYLSVQYTVRDGAEHRLFAGMFGIFGHGNVTGIGQALEEHGSDLTYYRPQNEQAMVHTAAAYARMKNRLSTFACTSSVGPGATNMLTGAALATVNRLPVLLLPGDIFANRIPHPVLQQLEYPLSQDMSVNDAFRPVSKYWDRIYRPEQLISSLPEAMRVLTDPAETGAVTICLPEDVQTEAFDFPTAMFEKRTWKIRRTLPPDDDLDAAAQAIANASNPIIVAGGGVIYSEATNELDTLATTFGIPVAETQAGKGALPWNHAWNAGPIGAAGGSAANTLAADADLVIAVGTRLADFTTASKSAFQHPDVAFIGLNVGSMDAHKLGAMPLIGDAKATLIALTSRLEALNAAHRPADTVTTLKVEWDAAVDKLVNPNTGGPFSQPQVIGVVNQAAGPEDVVVCAAGGMPGDLLKLWRSLSPKGYHVEYGYSCMGYEIAGGLGVKMAAPDRNVFVMVGDGSYLMMHTEIVTSIQEGVKLIIVLVDNSGFRCIRELQTQSGTQSFGNDLLYRDDATNRLTGAPVPIDFAANARSLGAVTFTATNPAELANALAQAKAETRTTLINCPVQSQERMRGFGSWWDVPVAEVSDQAAVNAARRAYEKDRQKQRFFV
ncbi:MAG TPA: 3D-(3,5/4)-trihydroxycyclohexane-1,2-dione acylhydrolase (decyclizing) [Thermomicrobiales bacterium]|nr:3D-(3,5/4)-trihydroxycyclohexane-1,2-dione acylhydrolase (decyclizing) [Thermomicrobiales bacterium]